MVTATVSVILALLPRSWGSSSGFACGCKTRPTCMGDEKCLSGKCQAARKRHYWVMAIGIGFLLIALVAREEIEG